MVETRSRSRTPPRSYRKCGRSCHDRRSRRRHSTRHCRRRSSTSSSSLSSWSSGNHHRPSLIKNRPVDPPPTNCLGVFGLSQHTKEITLLTVFGKYGPIEKAMIVYDAKTSNSRGFGFVYFNKLEDASAAKVQCNRMVLHERTIRVDYSVTERPHTPTPGVYMGDRDSIRRHRHSAYRARGRSYDDDYHHDRSRRSCSSRHDRHRRRHRHYRSITRTRSRSRTLSTAD